MIALSLLRFLSPRLYGKSGKAIIATKDEECFLLRAYEMHGGDDSALGYLYRWREREGREEAKGKTREDEKEGDREKGIRAGITLGDCGIVNPCRVALVLLLFLSPALSICLSLFHPLHCRPPFSLPSSPPSVPLFFSLSLSL